MKKMQRVILFASATTILSSLTLSCSSELPPSNIEAATVENVVKNPKIEFKESIVTYYGSKSFTEEDLLRETKLIDIADRRFESKWKNKDPKGISEEYVTEGAVFMKPGTKPGLGRQEIAAIFAESVQGTDRVEFTQDNLEYFGDMDVAFQRCHMLGFVDTSEEHVFEGSYIILWKKVDGEWFIEYDIFNSDK